MITVSNQIQIPNLSEEWIEGLAKLVSVKNEDKETALKEEIWGAQKMDDLLTLAEYKNDVLYLPRGFLDDFVKLVSEHNFEFQDHRIDSEPYIEWPKQPKFKDYQSEAIAQIVSNASGRVIAPPGKGKTVIGLGAASELQKPTLILVAQKHLAKQWQDRASEHFGMELGFIGDNKWDEKEISVALIQTLWSRREELTKTDWWDKWSVVILDEQHHIPAETFTHVVSQFAAKYRIGLSATVGKSEAKKKISHLIFGPIIYEIKETAIDPEVRIVNTEFEFDFYPTHKHAITGKRVQNNYAKLISELCADEKRNALIAKYVVENIDHANLIFSRRLAHLESIRKWAIDLGFPENRCWNLTGAESIEERMEVYDKADEGNCAIFSTIADEGLDVPRLDRGYLAFPEKNEENINQKFGRFTREHIDKKDAIVYDFVDKEIPVLKKQYGNRLRKHYQRNKLSVSVQECN